MSYPSLLRISTSIRDIPGVVRKYHDKARQKRLYQHVRSHIPEWMAIFSRYHGEKTIEQKAREIKEKQIAHCIWGPEINSLNEQMIMEMLFVTCEVQVTPREEKRIKTRKRETGVIGEMEIFRIRRKPLPTGPVSGSKSKIGQLKESEDQRSRVDEAADEFADELADEFADEGLRLCLV